MRHNKEYIKKNIGTIKSSSLTLSINKAPIKFIIQSISLGSLSKHYSIAR